MNDDEDDQVQALSNSNVQNDTNQANTSGLMTMCKIKWLVHHLNLMIKQVQIMFQYSNQFILQRDHPLDTIIGDISRGVQTRSRLASFCEHFSFVSSIEPKKIEEALKDIDWVNAMHEELNNFATN